MESNDEVVVPFMAVRPTEIIKDEIEARGMPRRAFARRMGMHPSNISRLLNGEDITMPIARRLEAALGIPAKLWGDLQASYEENVRAIAERERSIRRAFPSWRRPRRGARRVPPLFIAASAQKKGGDAYAPPCSALGKDE